MTITYGVDAHSEVYLELWRRSGIQGMAEEVYDQKGENPVVARVTE